MSTSARPWEEPTLDARAPPRPSGAPPSSEPFVPPKIPKYTPWTGTLLTPGPEWAGWLVSLGIGVAFALVIAWMSLVSPLPLGGDSGTWTALSYPFILYAHPSEIIPFGYPPLMFPVLGFFVLLAGPLVGPRIYLAFVGILLGLSAYVLGRSLFNFRVSALLAEALLFVTVPFDRLFFFGGYPTLLAMVFANLSIAFGIRYLRGRRPAHALLFWLATGATLLTHEFVGLALVVTLLIIGILLLVKRELPISLVASGAGAVGLGLAAAGVGAYYLGTRLAHVAQNNYFASNALGHLRFPISAVLYPLHVQSLGGLIGYQWIKTPNGSFAIAAGIILIGFFGMVVVGLRWPKYLTPSVIAIGASILAILVMAVGGWILSIDTDYRRFAYSLYLPFILLGLLAYDTVFRWCTPSRAPVATAPSAPTPASSPRSRPRPAPRRAFRSRRRPVLLPIVAIAGAVIVVLAGGMFVYPKLVAFRTQYTGNLHTLDYIDAMQAILKSDVPGSILSISAGATEHWTFALTDRNVYSPGVVSSGIFKGQRVTDDQLAYFPFHFRTAVTTDTNFVAVSGNASDFFNGAPTYGSLRYGTPAVVLALAPDGYSADVGGTNVPAWTAGDPVPLVTVTDGLVPSLTIHFVTSSYYLNVVSEAVPGGPVFINITATATGSTGLFGLNAEVRTASAAACNRCASIQANTFLWSTRYPTDATQGVVSPPAHVSTNAPTANETLDFHVASPSDTPISSLTLSLELSTPRAVNIGSPLPAVIETPSVLANWDTRFVLFNNVTKPIQASDALYFIEEYDATVLYRGGTWEVLLLPSPLP